MECGAKAEKGFTTDVTDLGSCLLIIRNVPCYKCTECNEIIYTADVVKRLENIVEQAKKVMQEISIIDYNKVACTPMRIIHHINRMDQIHVKYENNNIIIKKK